MTITDPAKFGPWATSLDSGSRLQLSAFWKQRMRRPPELTSPTRRSAWSVIMALVLAIFVNLSPLVELVPAGPADTSAKPGQSIRTEPKAVPAEFEPAEQEEPSEKSAQAEQQRKRSKRIHELAGQLAELEGYRLDPGQPLKLLQRPNSKHRKETGNIPGILTCFVSQRKRMWQLWR